METAGALASALEPLSASRAQAAILSQAALAQLSAAKTLPLDVAEWSYMWVNVKRADVANRSFIGGQQMYVEYMVPTRVRKPFPIVLVHGGGGQGTHWLGTPDGRPGWFQHLVAEGYKVYVVDRPGHGRAPQHPDTHGGITPRPSTMESLHAQLGPPADRANDPNKYRRNHTQWPGTGVVGSPEFAQFIANQGATYIVAPPPPGGAPAPPAAARAAGPPVPANQQPPSPLTAEYMEWRAAGADLLDKIGPAIIITHANAGFFGLFVAEARPNLVKAAVMYEAPGTGFSRGNPWGMSAIPVTWEPPVKDPSEIKTRWVANPEPDVDGYYLQEEPARRLPHLRDVAVLTVTAAAGLAAPGNPGAPAFLKQAGVKVAEEVRLASVGVHGNGHIPFIEKNHREALQPVLDWLDKNVRGSAPAIRKRGTESTALRLSNMGYFWVGPEVTKKDYGTVVVGQMYVQYLIPEQIRQPIPIVLVHGGVGRMLHYMGLDGNAGWAHYYVQNGYKVYLVDRPGHGRSPVHLDGIGQIGNAPGYGIAADFQRAATATPRRWMGTGQVGDPLLDQIVAGQNAAPLNTELMERLWRTRGAELLEKIGPAIIQTHSAGGPFGFFVANERPALTKAVVCFEGGAGPALGQNNQPNLLPNLKGMPIMYLTAENSGRAAMGQTITDALLKSGALAEHINLGKDRGINGNSHFAMFETNRKEVFEVIRGWIESKLPPNPATRQTARS